MKSWASSLAIRIWKKPFPLYRLRDLAALARTPFGRRQIKGGILFRLWPVTAALAAFYRRTLLRKVHVVAVVGSYGKTTAARAVTAALGRKIHPRIEGNSLTGVPRALFRIRPGHGSGVLEVGIDGKDQMTAMAKMVRPDIVVVMCVGTEHNRSFGTLEVTRDEKANMVRALPASGIAILNGDDPNVVWMASQTRAKIVTFGFGDANQVRATQVRLDWPHGTCFRLHAAGKEREVRIRLIGRYMVYAALAAVAVATAEGFSLDQILPRLEVLPPTPGRMVVKQLESGPVLLCDDHKAALETIHAALDVLAEIPAKRRVVVLGPISEPPGSQGPLYRALGARIAQIAQLALFVGSYRDYKPGVARAGMPRDAFINAGDDVIRVAEMLRNELRPGDVALIKGRYEQRMGRIALLLEGRPVRCSISPCGFKIRKCDSCPLLETGWDDRLAAL